MTKTLMGHATATITVMRLPLFAQVFALAIMAGALVVTTVPTTAQTLPRPDRGFPATTPMPENYDAATFESQLILKRRATLQAW